MSERTWPPPKWPVPDRTLYPGRIGVADPSWEPISGGEPISPPGKGIRNPGPRLGRIVANMRDPANWAVNPEALPGGSTWTGTHASMTRAVEAARDWADMTRGLQGQDPMMDVEADLASKTNVQRGAGPYWDVNPDGLQRPKAASMANGLRHVRLLFGELREPTALHYARGTNHGGPTFSTSDADLLLHAIMAARSSTWSRAQDVYGRIARMFDAPEMPHATTFSRTGHSKKESIVYGPALGGGLAPIARAKGLFPRRRHVFGVPSFANLRMLQTATALKVALFGSGFAGAEGGPPVVQQRLTRRGRHVTRAKLISMDISGFDQSVARTHQMEVGEHVFRPLTATIDPDFVAFWLAVEAMPVAGGPIHRSHECFMYDKVGITTSGIILTTIVGSCLTLALMLEATASAMGWTVAHAYSQLLAGAWDVLVFGDDIVLTVPEMWDADAAEGRCAELGYTVKSMKGHAFLMKWYDHQAGTWFPFATRVLQQTMFNEHGGRFRELELFGLWARTENAHHNWLFDRAWEVIRACDPSGTTPATRWDLEQLINTKGFQDALTTGLKAEPRAVADLMEEYESRGVQLGPLRNWLLTEAPSFRTPMSALEPAASATDDQMMELASWLSTPVDDRDTAPRIVTEMRARMATNPERQQ